MPWMLQPHNMTQIVRPNLYRVDYGRVGAYKGMGGLGQDVTDLPITTGQAAYIQANYPTVAAYDPAAGAGGMISATPTPTTTNYLPWILGGIVVLALFAGGRR